MQVCESSFATARRKERDLDPASVVFAWQNTYQIADIESDQRRVEIAKREAAAFEQTVNVRDPVRSQ